MPQRQNACIRILVGFMTVLLAAGCRDRAPSPPLYRDLGTRGELLLPLATPRYVIKSAEPGADRADWVAFRDPAAAAEEPPSKSDGDSDNSEVEEEIRSLIADYNELASDRDTEEMLAYFSEDEQEGLELLITSAFSLADKISELTAAVTAASPSAGESVADALAELSGSSGGALAIESITVTGENAAAAQLTKGSLFPKCRFIVVDDEWFISLPDDVDPAGIQAALTRSEKDCADWIEELSSGRISADDLVENIQAPSEESAGAPQDGAENSATDDSD